jgi:hypothetical protein
MAVLDGVGLCFGCALYYAAGSSFSVVLLTAQVHSIVMAASVHATRKRILVFCSSHRCGMECTAAHSV